MSHILLKLIPDSSITPSVSTEYIKIFSSKDNGGELYYVDSTGNKQPVGDKIIINEVTYNQLYSLGTSNGFVTASYYLIMDFESIYDQPDYYCDGSLKTKVANNKKPTEGAGWEYQPLLVQAISGKDLSEYAFQPTYNGPGYYHGFPKDKIKYDYTWNKTEFNKNAKGRITERIDEFGNRTDYDHRSIRFKRYRRYDKDNELSGLINDYNSVSGLVNATGASFSTELETGDVIIINSKSDLGYDIGLKVSEITDDNTMTVIVDSLIAATPSTVILQNGSEIIPVDYNFTGKFYSFYNTIATEIYDQYKEVYFGQSDEDDPKGKREFNELYTFDLTKASNNILDNYSNIYLEEKLNGFLILSNNVFKGNTINNKIGYYSYNNDISGNFRNNNIGNNFCNNYITDDFQNNMIHYEFSNNSINNGDVFRYNNTYCDVSGVDFTSMSHVYSDYTSNIILASDNKMYINYFDGSDNKHDEIT